MLAAWKPPGLMDGVAMPDISLMLDKIARGVLDEDGMPTGQLYSPAPNSGDRYVGKKIEAMLGAIRREGARHGQGLARKRRAR